MKFIIRLFSFLFIILFGCICLFVFLYARFTTPGPLVSDMNVVIPKGHSIAEISTLLHEKNVIDNAFVFEMGVFLTQNHNKMQAGEYHFTKEMSMIKTIELIASGKTVRRKITFPEGYTNAQILTLMEATEGLIGEANIQAFAEGSLMPETYFFSYGDEKQMLLKRMQHEMTLFVDKAWSHSNHIPHTIKTKHDIIILASIIEKETSIAAERPHIASVFYNRLKYNMRLQSDPTVIYAVSNKYGKLERPLSRKDLTTPSPYNTYETHGLPPTPICNPGKDSIFAALNPIQTDDLYFVANGVGGHVFAKSLEEHNKNVAKWRRGSETTSQELGTRN